MNLKLLFLAITCLASSLNFANDTLNKSRDITYKIDYSHLRFMDRQVTPLLYSGNIFGGQIGLESNKSTRKMGINFSLGLGTVKSVDYKNRTFVRPHTNLEGAPVETAIELSGIPMIQQEFNIWYLKRWKKVGSSKTQFFIGGNFKEFFYLSIGPSAVFMMNEFSLNPVLKAIHRLNSSTILSSSLSVPLTGAIVRLPYANDPADGKNGTFGSVYTMGTKIFTPIEFQKVNFNIGLEKVISTNWKASVIYDFYWERYTTIRGLTAYNNGLSIKFSKTLNAKK